MIHKIYFSVCLNFERVFRLRSFPPYLPSALGVKVFEVVNVDLLLLDGLEVVLALGLSKRKEDALDIHERRGELGCGRPSRKEERFFLFRPFMVLTLIQGCCRHSSTEARFLKEKD